MSQEKPSATTSPSERRVKHSSIVDHEMEHACTIEGFDNVHQESITVDRYNVSFFDHVKLILQRDMAKDTDNAFDRSKALLREDFFLVGGTELPFRLLSKDAKVLVNDGIFGEGKNNTCHDFFMKMWDKQIDIYLKCPCTLSDGSKCKYPIRCPPIFWAGMFLTPDRGQCTHHVLPTNTEIWEGEYMDWENLKRDGLQRGNKRSLMKCLKRHFLNEWETHHKCTTSITILKPEINRAFKQYHDSRTQHYDAQCQQFQQLRWPLLSQHRNNSYYGIIDVDNCPQRLKQWITWLDETMIEYKSGQLSRGGENALKILLNRFSINIPNQSIICYSCRKETTLQSELNVAVPHYSREICTKCNNTIFCRGCIRERQPLHDEEVMCSVVRCPTCNAIDGFIDDKLLPVEGIDDIYLLQKQIQHHYNHLQTLYQDTLMQYKKLQQSELNWKIENEKHFLGYANTQNVSYIAMREHYVNFREKKHLFLQRGKNNNEIFAKRWLSILTHSKGFVRPDTTTVLVDIFYYKGRVDALLQKSESYFAQIELGLEY